MPQHSARQDQLNGDGPTDVENGCRAQVTVDGGQGTQIGDQNTQCNDFDESASRGGRHAGT